MGDNQRTRLVKKKISRQWSFPIAVGVVTHYAEANWPLFSSVHDCPVQVYNSGIFSSPTKIPNGVKETGSSVLVLLNRSAAFDIVTYQILISSRADLGIRSYTQTQLSLYLQDRSLRVFQRNSVSSLYGLAVGVPQSSAPGPLLFILYT